MEFEEWSNKKKEQQDFEVWSNRQKERLDFEAWSNEKKAAQPSYKNYSAPYYGAGDAARLGVESTQLTRPKQSVQPAPAQPEMNTAPARSRGGITLHPGMEAVDRQAKAAQSQAPSPVTKIPETPVQKPYTPAGQSAKLGETNAPKTFTLSQSPKAEIPANRFSGESAALPGFEARTGMPAYDLAQKPLAAASPMAYTKNWNNREPESGGANYLGRSLNQLALGNLTDDATLLGTAAQVGLGIAGLDLPMDIRDITYDITNWEWTGEHIAQTLLDAVGFIPVVGSLKYADEFAAILKSADEVADLAKRSPELVELARDMNKLDNVLGSADEFGELLENVPEAADLFKNTDEAADLLDSTDELIEGAGEKIYSPVNPHPTLPKAVQNSFTGGTFTEKVLTEDTTFYRVHGGKAGQVGSYMSRTPQYGGMQSQLDLALNPDWGNTTAYVSKVTVPKGTVIYEGTAAPQVINGGSGMLYGGGNQVYIPKEELNSLWFGN